MHAGFNVAEVMELACQIERYGERFYRLAAGRTDDEGARKLLLDLADYEARHEEAFTEMKRELAGRSAAAGEAEAARDPDDTAGQYLRAMANGAVFEVDGDPGARLRGDESLEQLLRLALHMEQESIAFYTGIQRAMPASWGPERLDAVIDEERSHVVFISEELARRHRVAI
jgi:rubrerythrin